MIIQISLYLFIGLIFTILDLYFIRRETRIVKWITAFLFYTVLINTVLLGTLILLLHKPNALLPKLYHSFFALEYSAAACAIGCLLCLIQLLLTQRLVLKASAVKRPWADFVIRLVIVLSAFIGCFAIFFADWWLESFGQTKPDAFLHQLHNLITGQQKDALKGLLLSPMFRALYVTMPFLFIVYFNRFNINWNGRTRCFTLIPSKWIQNGLAAIAFALCISGIWYICYALHFIQVLKSMF